MTAGDTPDEFVIGENLYSHETYGLALAKNDDDFRLLVDSSLSRLYRSPEFEPVFTRYFGKPGPAVLLRYQTIALPE